MNLPAATQQELVEHYFRECHNYEPKGGVEHFNPAEAHEDAALAVQAFATALEIDIDAHSHPNLDLNLPMKAGPLMIGVTFLATHEAPGLDMHHACDRSTLETGGLLGVTFCPHDGRVCIDGSTQGAAATDSAMRATRPARLLQSAAGQNYRRKGLLETVALSDLMSMNAVPAAQLKAEAAVSKAGGLRGSSYVLAGQSQVHLHYDVPAVSAGA